ncbi:MAG: DUF1778 domain-containing protein [Actinomycetota bacterium]
MATDPDERKQDRISLRATPRQVGVIDQAAEALHKNRSDFMLDAAVQEAQRVLADRRTFVLSDSDRDAFLQLLDRPAIDKPRLRALLSGPGVPDRG